MDKPGIKNWHWRTKGVEPWAQEWFKRELTGVAVSGVTIASVETVEGDCELGMRKSKLVTIYDQKISMTWTAAEEDGTEVKGNLTAVEVAHDMDEDEYVFTSTLDTATPNGDKFHRLAKKDLANKLRPIFQRFPKELVATHGKDLLADIDSGATTPASGATTPAPAPVAAASTSAPKKAAAAVGSTTSSSVQAEYQAAAADLFDLLTNESKIPMWTRNPAKFEAKEGGEVSLFGGNIQGKVTAIDAPTSLKQTWRAPTWPEGHFGELSIQLRQGSNSTNLALTLTGVPIGKEEETERNLDIFYLNGLKSIGWESFSFPASATTGAPGRTRRAVKPEDVSWAQYLAVQAGPFLISVGVIAALLAGFYYGPSGPGGKTKAP